VTSLRELLEGKYEILGQLDDDGAGEVYKVRHLFLDEVRLVRVVRPEAAPGREARTSQLDEARAAMRLRHPNIAQLHDFSLDDEGNAFIVLESIDGLPLDAALRELGPPPVGLALEIAQQALRALGYLHHSGRVLRHVAPERLMLTRDVDGRPLAKWTDLGISRLLGAEEEVPLGGLFPANPRWAAPEQFGAAGREPDARSDLYAFGLLLYELLTGRFPIAGHDPFSYMAGHLSLPPLGFADSDPQGRLPAEIREAVLQTLARDPAQRPASAEELARRLVAIQDRFPEQGDYLERALGEARKRTAMLRPVVLPPKPEPPPPPAPEPPVVAPVLAPPPVVPKAAPAPPPKPPEPPPRPAPPVVAPVPVPVPEPIAPDDLPLRGVEPARQLEWDRPRMEYGTQRVQIEPPAPAPVRPAPPVAPPPRVSPAEPAGSRLRWLLILAGIAIVAVLGGAIGAFLGRGSDEPRPAGPAPAAQVPQPEAEAPASTPPQIVEVAPPPEPPPPPANEKAEPAAPPPSLREEQAREEARRRREALRPPTQVPEKAVIKAPAGPMKRGDLITPGPGVEYPEPATDIEAAYPARAVESRRSAKVRVAVLVDENGNVVQTRIRDGDPSGLGFNESAQEAARRVRFLPATRDGVPGKFWTELMFEFEPPAAPAAAPSQAPETPLTTAPPPGDPLR
jgi:serine/threonine-protein kinase